MTWACGFTRFIGGKSWTRLTLAVWLASLGAGCATRLPAPMRIDPAPSALSAPSPTQAPVEIASRQEPDGFDVSPALPSLKAIQEANRQALREARGARLKGAMLRYPYAMHHVYRIDVAVGFPVTLVFAPGELLLERAGLGDDWIFTLADVGDGLERSSRLGIAAKHPKLHEGLTVMTNKAVYALDLRSHSHKSRRLTFVSWEHPPPPELRPVVRGPRRYHLGYDVQAMQRRVPLFMPVAAWDNGRQTVIELPPQVQGGELPQVYAVAPTGEVSLVNWRVRESRVIVDQVVSALELRARGEAVRIMRGEGYRAIDCPGADVCGTIEGGSHGKIPQKTHRH